MACKFQGRMAVKASVSKTEKMMATFDFQGKTYSIDAISDEARSAIGSLDFVDKLKTELQAKKIIIAKLLKSIKTEDNPEIKANGEKLNEPAIQEQLIEINNKLQVLDTARIAYSKQLHATLVESDT